jgi:hypothetical protein
VGWDERLALDVWYVDHRSTWLDLRILVRTMGAVLSRTGISAEGEATMGVLRPTWPSSPRRRDARQPADGPVDGGDTSTAEGPSR